MVKHKITLGRGMYHVLRKAKETTAKDIAAQRVKLVRTSTRVKKIKHLQFIIFLYYNKYSTFFYCF
jgi:hypothetical protein